MASEMQGANRDHHVDGKWQKKTEQLSRRIPIDPDPGRRHSSLGGRLSPHYRAACVHGSLQSHPTPDTGVGAWSSWGFSARRANLPGVSETSPLISAGAGTPIYRDALATP